MENNNDGRVDADDQEYRIWVEGVLAARKAGMLQGIQMPDTAGRQDEEAPLDGMDEIDILEGRTNMRDQLRRL